MRVLVTGGAGFIGSNLADRLIELGHEVAILDDLSTGFRDYMNPRAKFYEADLTTSALDDCVRDFHPEVVSHHAAQIDVRRSVTDPLLDARINILGSIALLQACTRNGVRKVIFASTGGAIYGEGRQLPATEQHPVRPEAPYGASKHSVEHYLHLWKLLHGLDWTALRYPNVFGPRQSPHGEAGVNAIFIGLMLEGKRPRVFGSGEQVRDYVYVDDVVAANVAALTRGSGEILNLGTGIPTSVNDIVVTVNRILGTKLDPIREPERPGEVQRIYLDATRAKEVLEWIPTVSFEDGLRRTVEWMKQKSSS